MKIFLFTFLIFGGITSCQRIQDPIPSVHPELQITKIKFPGIADENVKIDPLKWTIYVKMPSLLRVNKLNPTIVLSQEAKLTFPGVIEDIGNISRWSDPDGIHLTIGLSQKNKSGDQSDLEYTIKPMASAPLSITHSEPLPDFVIGNSSDIFIDVQNVYGNSLPKSVVFTHKKTGSQYILSTVSLYTLLNEIRISASLLPFELGEYDIFFKMPNGTELKVPQTLTVKQGKSTLKIGTKGVSLSSLAGKKLEVNGENLFEKNVSFRLLFPEGTTLPLMATYKSDGLTSILTIPDSLSPGYYGVEILRDNYPIGTSYRLSILKNEEQLFISALNELPFGNYPTNIPIILPRNQPIPIHFRMAYRIDEKYVERYSITYVNESNALSIFRIPLTINFSIGADPYFIIPFEVPSGKYRAIIQEVDPITKKIIQESEPFERVVILQ